MGAGVFLCFLLFLFFQRTRHESKRFESLFKARTIQLNNSKQELEIALESHNGNDISRILQTLTEVSSQQHLDAVSKEAIGQISDEVMMAEYDNAKKIVAKLIEPKHGN